MTTNIVKIKEKVLFCNGEDWVEEAGTIPEQTCPDINKMIKSIKNAVDNSIYLRKTISREQDLESAIKTADSIGYDIEWDLSDIEGELEKLRTSNEQLRALGIFWYEKCKILNDLIKEPSSA